MPRSPRDGGERGEGAATRRIGALIAITGPRATAGHGAPGASAAGASGEGRGEGPAQGERSIGGVYRRLGSYRGRSLEGGGVCSAALGGTQGKGQVGAIEDLCRRHGETGSGAAPAGVPGAGGSGGAAVRLPGARPVSGGGHKGAGSRSGTYRRAGQIHRGGMRWGAVSRGRLRQGRGRLALWSEGSCPQHRSSWSGCWAGGCRPGPGWAPLAPGGEWPCPTPEPPVPLALGQH